MQRILPAICLTSRTRLLTIRSMERVAEARRQPADFKALWECARFLHQHYVRDHPKSGFRECLSRSAPLPDFVDQARRLRRDGILFLRSYFPPEALRVMQEDFDRFVRDKDTKEPEGSVSLNESTGVFLRDSIPLSRAAVDPALTALAAYYFGRPVVLAQSYGIRIEPREMNDYGAFQWHHDAKRHQIKVMVLLTDVASEGQRMDYIPGTHRLWHLYSSYEDTRFSDDEARMHGIPVRCTGSAGTVILFDTNGLHRGNRNLGPRRDVWVFQYTSGSSLFPLLGLHPQVTNQLTPDQKRIARLPRS